MNKETWEPCANCSYELRSGIDDYTGELCDCKCHQISKEYCTGGQALGDAPHIGCTCDTRSTTESTPPQNAKGDPNSLPIK